MGRALDPDCLRYLDHWEPVLAAPSRRALDRLGPDLTNLLDLGAGTGSVTLAALDRWPGIRVHALDASGAMLAVARSRVMAADLERVTWTVADAAALPLDDGSVDGVVCSFVLQLVAERPSVLAEVSRVLRPGGRLSLVTWLADDLVLPADATYHEVIGDIGDDEEVDEDVRSPCSGDYASLDEARGELEAAGFEAIDIARDELRHAWTAESYLAFKTEYEDHERLDSLGPGRRRRLLAALAERLARLPAPDFELRGPLVAAVARKPDKRSPASSG